MMHYRVIWYINGLLKGAYDSSSFPSTFIVGKELELTRTGNDWQLLVYDNNTNLLAYKSSGGFGGGANVLYDSAKDPTYGVKPTQPQTSQLQTPVSKADTPWILIAAGFGLWWLFKR